MKQHSKSDKEPRSQTKVSHFSEGCLFCVCLRVFAYILPLNNRTQEKKSSLSTLRWENLLGNFVCVCFTYLMLYLWLIWLTTNFSLSCHFLSSTKTFACKLRDWFSCVPHYQKWFNLTRTIYSTFLGCWHIDHHQTNNHLHPPGPFGDYYCDSPWSLLESATTAMRAKQGDNVEFVLWTG